MDPSLYIYWCIGVLAYWRRFHIEIALGLGEKYHPSLCPTQHTASSPQPLTLITFASRRRGCATVQSMVPNRDFGFLLRASCCFQEGSPGAGADRRSVYFDDSSDLCLILSIMLIFLVVALSYILLITARWR